MKKFDELSKLDKMLDAINDLPDDKKQRLCGDMGINITQLKDFTNEVIEYCEGEALEVDDIDSFLRKDFKQLDSDDQQAILNQVIKNYKGLEIVELNDILQCYQKHIIAVDNDQLGNLIKNITDLRMSDKIEVDSYAHNILWDAENKLERWKDRIL